MYTYTYTYIYIYLYIYMPTYCLGSLVASFLTFAQTTREAQTTGPLNFCPLQTTPHHHRTLASPPRPSLVSFVPAALSAIVRAAYKGIRHSTPCRSSTASWSNSGSTLCATPRLVDQNMLKCVAQNIANMPTKVSTKR